ncbi:MAG TPA: helix-turn-helix transcriptional regulator [Propionibacteriaceae bacterium]|nr:helix-turn-helix transcriptional regulator [Propionibacteriaceae bacterium]
MSQDLSTTSYALLGLMAFDGPDSASMTGYELKQRADRTLRFYWVAPAMSQVYSELERLTRLALVQVNSQENGRRKSQRYQITEAGVGRLQDFADSPADFPILKHPPALKLMMGALIGPRRVSELLESYLAQLAEQRRDLLAVRSALGDAEARRYPAMVADWGLSYYDSEADIVRDLLSRLPDPESA